jgi:hypothetical protein
VTTLRHAGLGRGLVPHASAGGAPGTQHHRAEREQLLAQPAAPGFQVGEGRRTAKLCVGCPLENLVFRRQNRQGDAGTFLVGAAAFDDGAALALEQSHTVAGDVAAVVLNDGLAFKNNLTFFR